jgi:hypothetical protein
MAGIVQLRAACVANGWLGDGRLAKKEAGFSLFGECQRKTPANIERFSFNLYSQRA